jgi:hypothetical protein
VGHRYAQYLHNAKRVTVPRSVAAIRFPEIFVGPRMDTNAHEWESNLTEAIIGSASEVVNVLAAGFLEKVGRCGWSGGRAKNSSWN